MNPPGLDVSFPAGSAARTRLGRMGAAASAALLLTTWTTGGTAGAEMVTIGIVRDGSEQGAALIEQIRAELPKHLPHGTEAVLRDDPAFDAGWDPEQVAGALDAALADPQVDIVLLTGALATVAAARPDVELDKPVLSAFVQHADLFQLAEAGKDNLVVTVLPGRAERDFEAFRALVPFSTLHVAIDRLGWTTRGDLAQRLPAAGEQLGLGLRLVPADGDAESLLAQLPDGVEALYLGPLPRFGDAERQALMRGLAERGIPSFSQLGHADVGRGALAAITPDLSGQLARRLALHLARLARGTPAADLEHAMSAGAELLLNAETARAIGYVPDQATRMFAAFVHSGALDEGTRELDLQTAMRMAEEQNTALAIQDSIVESTRQDAAIARTFLLPQIRADLAHLQTDAALTFGPAGLATDGATQGALSLRQLIYDDPTWSARKAALKLVAASEAEREAVRLDVLAEAGAAYLNLAFAEALFRVDLDNLQLTDDFLELARLREEVGYSGRDEILRWEATVAGSKSALYLAFETVATARIALNRVLDVDQDQRWRLDQITGHPEKLFVNGRLSNLQGRLDDTGNRARGALAEIAIERSPEVQALRAAIVAQQIRVKGARRRYYIPSIVADVTVGTEIDEGEASVLPDAGDTTTLSIVASYPIFEGGRKGREVARATADLETLERQLELLSERLEQRARTATRQAESSFPRIELSVRAADAANENLKIVQDQYTEGIVNVTDLLSAQNQRFIADQLATVAFYEFLLDLLELQRALSWFEVEQSAEDKDRFVERILAAVEESGP